MAGKRAGTKDDRYLWPEMLRVIKEFKPRWVIGENVFGLLSMAVNESEFDLESDADNGSENNEEIRANSVVWRIKQDLLNIGYDCEVLCIPACAVNAPHRRDRLWFIANRNTTGQQNRNKQYRRSKAQEREGKYSVSGCSADTGFIAHTKLNGLQNGCKETGRENGKSEQRGMFKPSGKDRITSNSKSTGQQSGEHRPWQKQFWGSGTGENWIEVAAKLCGVDDGLPAELDGFKLSKAGHRVARIKGLGNAIVPQVAIELMSFIKEIDDKK